eukprot:5455847-Prymnesium_polylepis.1
MVERAPSAQCRCCCHPIACSTQPRNAATDSAAHVVRPWRRRAGVARVRISGAWSWCGCGLSVRRACELRCDAAPRTQGKFRHSGFPHDHARVPVRTRRDSGGLRPPGRGRRARARARTGGGARRRAVSRDSLHHRDTRGDGGGPVGGDTGSAVP